MEPCSSKYPVMKTSQNRVIVPSTGGFFRGSTSSLSLLVGLSLFYGITGSAAIRDSKHERYLSEGDQLTEWISGHCPYPGNPKNANELIKFRNAHADRMRFISHWVDLGKTGNYRALGNALFQFECAMRDLLLIMSYSVEYNNEISLPDYREFFKMAGRAAAVRDLINELEEFRRERDFAVDRMRRVNTLFHYCPVKVFMTTMSAL